METVLEHEIDDDTLPVVRGTAVALGLPPFALEATKDSGSLASPDQAAGAASGALVVVVCPRCGAGTSRVSDSPSTYGVSGEGGIVRFDLGSRRGRRAC